MNAEDLQLHSFFTPVLNGGEWPTSRPSCFTPGREPCYSLNMRLGGSQSLSGHFGEEKNTCPFPEFELQNIQLLA
jgi:hypothetical protein